MNISPLLLPLMLVAMPILAQEKTMTYAEKLGFPAGAKVVIFHVDDAGMSAESNAGTIQALEKGVASSTSVMMPCGWVPQFMDYLKKHPTVDAGVHLTLTAEWDTYRWQPLTGHNPKNGLTDEQGAFWHNVPQVVAHAAVDAVEAEMRAQIARYRSFDLEPTHLDSHMGTLFQPKFLPSYLKVGMTEKIPVLFPGGHATLVQKSGAMTDALRKTAQQIGQQLWDAGLPVLDDLHAESYGWNLSASTPPTDENLRKLKTDKYIDLLTACQPGITYVIMHCTDPTPNFEQITNSGPTRKGDLLAMTDPRLREFVKQQGIIVTTWRELMERRKAK
jgi:chitin disaccharide deacetylase